MDLGLSFIKGGRIFTDSNGAHRAPFYLSCTETGHWLAANTAMETADKRVKHPPKP
jgi:hypothetical protein